MAFKGRGHCITDEVQFQEAERLRQQLGWSRSRVARAELIRKLLAAYGINEVRSFQDAEDCIEGYRDASRRLLEIKKRELREGMPVNRKGRRGHIHKFTWNGYVNVRFDDGEKPIGVMIGPDTVELPASSEP